MLAYCLKVHRLRFFACLNALQSTQAWQGRFSRALISIFVLLSISHARLFSTESHVHELPASLCLLCPCRFVHSVSSWCNSALCDLSRHCRSSQVCTMFVYWSPRRVGLVKQHFLCGNDKLGLRIQHDFCIQCVKHNADASFVANESICQLPETLGELSHSMEQVLVVAFHEEFR